MPFDIKQESEFIQACANNQTETVSALLKANHSLANAPASNGSYPLMFAAEQGFVQLTDMLLKYGAEIDATPKAGAALEGCTALLCAAIQSEWDIFEHLLARGAGNLDASCHGVTVLWSAAATKQRGWYLFHELLMRGAGNLDASPTEGKDRGKTILWFAAIDRQWGLVDELLKRGANNLDASPAEGKDRGITILWNAVANHQWGLVNELLKRGAGNLDTSPAEGVHQGITALWLAASEQQWGLVKALLKREGVNLDAIPTAMVMQQGTTLLWTIIKRHDETFRLLLNKGASLALPGNTLMQPENIKQRLAVTTLNTPESYMLNRTLDAAIALFNCANNPVALNIQLFKQIIKDLCQGGVEPALNGRFDGKTALHAAIEKNNLPAIEELVIHGADVLLPDNQQQTAKSLSSLPLIQAFAHLQECNHALDKILSNSQKQHEYKERVENLMPILEPFKAKILELSLALKPEHKNILYYKLGELLEKALPYVPSSMIVDLFSKITSESKKLYKQANAKLLHYAMLEPQQSVVDAHGSLDSEIEERGKSKLVLACQAGSKADSALFVHAVVDTLCPQSQNKHWSLVEPTDDFSRVLTKTLTFLQQKIVHNSHGNSCSVTTTGDHSECKLEMEQRQIAQMQASVPMIISGYRSGRVPPPPPPVNSVVNRPAQVSTPTVIGNSSSGRVPPPPPLF